MNGKWYKAVIKAEKNIALFFTLLVIIISLYS